MLCSNVLYGNVEFWHFSQNVQKEIGKKSQQARPGNDASALCVCIELGDEHQRYMERQLDEQTVESKRASQNTIVYHLIQYRTSPWPKTAEKHVFCPSLTDRRTIGLTHLERNYSAILTELKRMSFYCQSKKVSNYFHLGFNRSLICHIKHLLYHLFVRKDWLTMKQYYHWNKKVSICNITSFIDIKMNTNQLQIHEYLILALFD